MFVMKSFKRIFSIALFLIISATLCSQRISLEVGGALTGLQQSTAAVKKGDFNLLSSAIAGPEIEIALSEKYGIDAAALFEMRAGRYDISWYKPGTTFTRNLYYAQVPLNLTYRKVLSPKVNLLLNVGPRLNIGLFGTTNEHYYLATRTQVNDSSCFAGNNQMKRMDVGFDIGVGLELNRFQFKLNYDFPITNSANVSDLTTLKQHQLQLTIGYSLKKLKKKEISSQDAKPAVSK